MKQPLLIHQPSLIKQFDRRADSIGQADFLFREVERRMLARLDFIKLAPAAVLDLGCGQAHGASALQERFAQAQVVALDLSCAMLASSRHTRQSDRVKQSDRAAPRNASSLVSRVRQGVKRVFSPQAIRPHLVAADAHALPFSNGSFDLVWTNLSMHWWVDPVKVLAECRRVLRPEGLLVMSGFGPDTLTELRHLNAQFDEKEFVPTFQDLHDVGDALNQHQFADPVMDMERLTIEYQQPDRLLADLRAMGGNSLTSRNAGLKGVGWLRALNRHLASEFAAVQKHGNAFSLSFEIVYGHAWVPKPKSLPEGYSPIEFRPRQNRMPP